MNSIEFSQEQIREEVQSLLEAAKRIPRTREAALSFLKRVGADGWPSVPEKESSSSSRGRNRK